MKLDDVNVFMVVTTRKESFGREKVDVNLIANSQSEAIEYAIAHSYTVDADHEDNAGVDVLGSVMGMPGTPISIFHIPLVIDGVVVAKSKDNTRKDKASLTPIDVDLLRQELGVIDLFQETNDTVH